MIKQCSELIEIRLTPLDAGPLVYGLFMRKAEGAGLDSRVRGRVCIPTRSSTLGQNGRSVSLGFQ